MSKQNLLKNTLSIDADSLFMGTSVDCVIFGFHGGTMKILLNKFAYYPLWMLPGGFIYNEENLDDAAYRVLHVRTGLHNLFLQQFYMFGDAGRTNLAENREMLIRNGFDINKYKNHWLIQRFVSVGYYALVDYSKVKIQANEDEEIAWFDVNDIPQLYSDHNNILEKAFLKIKTQLNYIPIGYELLPEKFTMTQLRIIYETILKKKLDRRNFQRKMLGTKLIYKLDEVSKRRGVKASALFSFDKEKYLKALEDGLSDLD